MDHKQLEIQEIDYFTIELKKLNILKDIFNSYHYDPEMKRKFEEWLKKRHIANSDMSNSTTTKL